MEKNFFTQWKRWLGWATKKKPKKKKIVAAITSLVQSEVVEVESILLVKLFQLEAKNQVSLSEEILDVFFLTKNDVGVMVRYLHKRVVLPTAPFSYYIP